MLNSTRLLNMVLRASTLGARFVFVFFMARYLDAKSVGYYGLFTATVGYFLYLVGLDFYTFTTREILKAPNEQRGQMLKGQASLSVLLYLVVVPVAFWVLPQAHWPHELLYWFFPILVFEHLNQEISRLLITLSEQITASVILFVRQGSWAFVVVAFMTVSTSARQLSAVMACWLAAGVAAAIIGIRKIHQTQMGGWHLPVNWQWIKKGVVISLAFLLATLALRGVQTVDRYWLQSLTNIETVGAYVLFISVASTMIVFLDAGVFAFAYPELIALHHKEDQKSAIRKVNQLLIYISVVSCAFVIVSWELLPLLLRWINKPLYIQNINLYLWVLAATIINAFGMAFHYDLYARGKDKIIIFSQIIAMIAFFVSVLVFEKFDSTLAVPAGLIVFFTVILISKSTGYYIIRNKDDKKQQFINREVTA